MALKATIFKADLSIADMDRNYYADHALTLARHPSETDERMMVRLAAFALNAHERLAFGGGISTEDEPALWRRDLTGAIEQWIDVGLPEARDLRRAWGSGALWLPVVFFLLVATAFPFAVGPDAPLLARTGGGMLWVAALLAALLPIDRLIRPDKDAGVLDQLAVRGIADVIARQISARGGELWCEDRGDRVRISGHGALYLTGFIEID